MEVRRIAAPTDEQLAEAEAEVERKRAEREFEENRERQNARRPPGAAKLARNRAFGASVPPLNRGPIDMTPDPEPEPETPARSLRQLRVAETIETTAKPAKQKKSRFDVPETRNASTLIKGMGVLYVEERKQQGPVIAFQNLRDSIMMNLDALLPAMPQIKQMFELLQIGEPERKKDTENGKAEKIETLTGGLRRFLQGDDE